jgi:hypothetical protein
MACMAVTPAEILDFAASLPETSERDYRGDSTIFTFRGRGIGLVTGDGRHLFVKALLAERDVMIESDPEVYAEWWAAGRYGWVRVRLDRIDLAEARELVLEAWRLTAPKKLVRDYDAAHPVA